VNQCLTSGFIPRTFLPLQLLARILARIQVFIQLGRVRIIGAENLKPKGRVIFCPNHSAMFDAPVIFSIMKLWPRYMTAYEEMRGLWGLKAVAMGAFGCFAVDRSKGKTVLEPAIKVPVRLAAGHFPGREDQRHRRVPALQEGGGVDC
jgi:1-acyl-sn-glycerol-3-phosphate acyltransferase